MSASADHVTATALGLHELGRDDAPTVGGKAANLGELVHAGFDVPDGVVVVGEPDAAVVAQALAAAERLGAGPLAVRSSIAAEDLADASFAGQYESVLGVEGPDALAAAVRRVRASVTTDRVRRYERELAGDGIGAVGVLVQRQVAADAAGVAFSANPVTGATDEVVVNAVRGVGERLMAGEADADEWVVRAGAATCLRSPEGSLRAAQVQAVAALARRVAEHYGRPMDIEWAFEGARLWLLQARPITALPPAGAPEAAGAAAPASAAPGTEAAAVVSGSAQVEAAAEMPAGYWERDYTHFPQPIAPMSRLFLEVSTDGLTAAVAEAGLPFDGMEFREIGGWTYLRVVPLGGKPPPRLPGWLAPLANTVAARVHPPLRRRVARLAEVERTDALIGLVDRWWDTDRSRYVARVRGLQDVALPALSDAELDRHFAAAVRLCVDATRLHHRLHLTDILFPVRLALLCHEHLGWSEQRTLELLAGLSGASTEPGRALAELAELAADRPAVRALLAQPDAAAVRRLDEVDAAFAEAFHAYLYEFGCRALRYDVAEPTLAERPEVALGLVRDQLERSYDADGRAAAQQAQRDETLAEARAALASRPSAVRESFEWLLARAVRAYPVREDNEFFLVSAPLALLRYAALEVGRRLAERGRLERAEQVFALEVAEVGDALAGRTALQDLVRRREGELARARAHPGPATYGAAPAEPKLAGLPALVQEHMRGVIRGIELIFEADQSGREQDGSDGTLRGLAASAGVYSGPVRVIRDEREFDKIRAGDVLVCPITSPVWSVLFASVGALITDTGGVLSHAAIIAREYRIPAVVATGNATTLLRDGQRVTVDGAAGTVTLEPDG